MQTIKRWCHEQGMFYSWALSVLATAGSLYFSEVVGYVPCELCWYQRILMYPLVILLGLAAIRKENGTALYGMIFSGIGSLVALFHYIVQKTDLFQTVGQGCGPIPCAATYIDVFGFITIPFLALIAFTAIFVIQLFTWKWTSK